MGKTETQNGNKFKENHATKVTEIRKKKLQKSNETNKSCKQKNILTSNIYSLEALKKIQYSTKNIHI